MRLPQLAIAITLALGCGPASAVTMSFADPIPGVIVKEPSGTVTPAQLDGELDLSDPVAAADGGSVSMIFVPFVPSLRDVTVEALVNPEKNSLSQHLLYTRIDFATSSAYAGAVDFSTGELVISRAVNAVVTTLASVTYAQLSSSEAYRLRFSTTGETFLELSLFDEAGNLILMFDTVDNDSEKLVSPGPWGLGVGLGGTPNADEVPLSGSFNNVATTAPIPVPLSLPLLATGLAGFGVLRARRSQIH